MRLCTIKRDAREQAAVVTPSGIVPVAAINAHLRKAWPEDLHALIVQGIDLRILADAGQTPVKLDPASVRYGPLYTPAQDTRHRPELSRPRRRPERAVSDRAGVFHEV